MIPPIIYFGATFSIYGAALVGGIGKVYEILFIPSLQYLNMFLAWLLIYFFLWIETKIDGGSQSPPKVGASVLWVSGVLITYTLLVLTSHFFRNVPIPFLILMEIFALIFLVGACVTYMFHKKLLGPFNKKVQNTSSTSEAAYRNPSISDDDNETVSTKDDKL